MNRTVSADIELLVSTDTQIVFQVAVAQSPGLSITETLDVTLDETPLDVREVLGATGSRNHVVNPGPGRLVLHYRAEVLGRAQAPEVLERELLEYRRPSRYAEADKLLALATREFGHLAGADLVTTVAAWVGTHLAYVSGSSDSIDGSVDTFLLGQGVCRDYAHLVVALLRARDVPARAVAVYAPGLSPMDFHAVAEAFVDGRWLIVDATLLAPRQSMLRIATGRDAADTAFIDSFGDTVTFQSAIVTATVDGALPVDDPREPAILG